MKTDKLKKIIEFAGKNGFPQEEIKLLNEIYGMNYLMASIGAQLDRPQYYSLLFSHDFAKAVFGEEWVCTNCGQEQEQEEGEAGICEHNHSVDGQEKSFEYHLKQAVISKPIDYYYKYVKDR